MSEYPPPFLPESVDLTDYPAMMLDIGRLRGSEFDAITDDTAWRAGVNLWLSSWHQVPAGSLKGSDAQFAKLAGLARDLATWERIKADAMRGWTLCADGRFYHRVVCEVALEAWLTKLRQWSKSGKGNQRRWGRPYDAKGIEAKRQVALDALARLQGQAAGLTEPTKSLSNQDESPRDASGMPQRSPSDPNGSEASFPTERPAATEDHNREAWRRAKALLASQGKLSEAKAATFFGGLLKDNPGLEARDLLASIVTAESNGTGDPKSYLVKAARAIVARKQPGAQPARDVSTWTADVWRSAVRNFADDGGWTDQMGPRPDHPGCLAPASILIEYGYLAAVIPIAGRGTV